MEEIKIKKASKRNRHKNKLKDKSAIELEMEKRPEKSKEQILAERQAKKAGKKQNKSASDDKKPNQPTTSVEKVSPANPTKKELPASPTKPLSKKTPPTSPAKESSCKVAATPTKTSTQNTSAPEDSTETPEKTREQVKAEREAKKLAKQASKKKGSDTNQKTESTPQQQQPKDKKQSEQKPEYVKVNSDTDLAQKMETLHITEASVVDKKEPPKLQEKPATTKAERRAMQEAQRAAKAKAQEKVVAKVVPKTPAKAETKTKEVKPQTPHHKAPSSGLHKVKLFKHLYTEKCNLDINVNGHLHPAILKLGVQYANDTIVGSNARCYALLNALRILVNDYETPEEKVFSRGLESEIQTSVEFLQKCRPLAVSMINALKHIKLLISQETSSDSDLTKKQRIMTKIETYAHEQIETAAIAISLKVREKISNDDVILTYGCSSLIKRSLVEAWKEGEKRFSVIVVDSRPDYEGQEMLKSLAMEGISCTYVLINAISFIMPKVTKVLLGAHALLANGYVMSRVGTAQISLVANYFNVPVLICCETHKFSERVQTDSFVYNELGDPNALAFNKNSKTNFEYLKDWQSIPHLTPLNLRYDITSPELITAVVTEVALLPCTSVQVILRVKPAE